MNKSVILLSGGLDSLVSIGLAKDEFNIKLALTFDYGQKSASNEIEASKKIAKHYGVEHRVISLDWLKEITHTSLVSDSEIPKDGVMDENSRKKVWVPNRNGLFLNIAGCFADSENFSHIIIGANKEESQTFPDNTSEFVDRVNKEFEFSTQVKPKLIAPLINFNKDDIVRVALEHDIPLELVYSCYSGGEKHCGVCESCRRLKQALINNNDNYFIKLIFGNN